MSFTSEIKSEIIKKSINGLINQKAFLAGFIRSTGSLIRVGKDFGFEYSIENKEISDFISDLFYSVFGFFPSQSGSEKDWLNGSRERVTYQCVGERGISVLSELEILSKTKKRFDIIIDLNVELLKTEEAKRSFIKGVFLGAGNVTLPKKTKEKVTSTGYHLELKFTSYRASSEFISLLESFSINTRIIEKKEHFLVYIKSAESIKDFLALINTPKAVLKLTDRIIEKEIMNNVNRAKNCDLANVNKQLLASEKQINAINLIEKTFGLDYLSNDLKETAIFRRDNPEFTLNELSDEMGITKSCLNHRLRKIISIAETVTKD